MPQMPQKVALAPEMPPHHHQEHLHWMPQKVALAQELPPSPPLDHSHQMPQTPQRDHHHLQIPLRPRGR